MKINIKFKQVVAMLMTALLCLSCSTTAGAADSAKWQSRMPIPTESQIRAYNQISSERAPYVQAWMDTDKYGRFSEYAIEFRADYVPASTYCSLFNFYMDYSSLTSTYARVYTECGGISGYAGLQQRSAGEKPNSILSFWDVYCEDQKGNVVKVIRPTLVYPENTATPSFDGEGEGSHYLPDYDWKPGRWYCMLMQIGTSETTGNTTVLQYFRDLETGVWTYACAFDLGAPNLAFIGPSCIFLECFNPKTSGEIRTMEVRNIRIAREWSDKWESVRSGTFTEGYGWPGSYQYGTDGDTFWMISTGIRGMGKTPMKNQRLEVSSGSTNRPY